MVRDKYAVQLALEQREELQRLIRVGKHPARVTARARSWTSAGSSMPLDASLTVIRPCSTASRPAGTAGLSSDSTLAAWTTVLPLTRSSAAASPQVKEWCKFAPFSCRGRPGADHAESLWGSPQWPPSSVPARDMEAAKPGSRSRSTDVSWVVQGRRAAHRPSSRRPSRFFRLRVPRTEHALSNLEPIGRRPGEGAGRGAFPWPEAEPDRAAAGVHPGGAVKGSEPAGTCQAPGGQPLEHPTGGRVEVGWRVGRKLQPLQGACTTMRAGPII